MAYNSNKGSFTITARDLASIQIVIIKINELLKKSKPNISIPHTHRHPSPSKYKKPVPIQKISVASKSPFVDNTSLAPVSEQMNIVIEKITGYKWLPGKNWGDN